MALDIEELARQFLNNALQSGNGGSDNGASNGSSDDGGGMKGIKGLALGAGAAALAPAALKGARKLATGLGVDGVESLVKSPGDALGNATSKLGDKVTSTAKEKGQEALEEAGGPGGMVKDAVKGMLPFGGGGGGNKGGAPGVGKGRRMPVQQWVDIGLPVETVYNQWTQFEDWPTFMHRVTRVTQEDPCTVSFATKIWGRTKEFKAKIETQRPDDRIKWSVTEGMTHTGVVTFHEIGPNLTRVILSFDVDPGSLIEKFARGARHVKRAARADLHRFMAFIEMAEHETGAWRGVIEDGELVEDHDPSYDEQREYSDIEDVTDQDEDEDEEQDEDEQDDDEQEEPRDEDDQDDESQERSQRRSRAATGGAKKQASRGRARKSQSSSNGRSRTSTKASSSGRKAQSSSNGRSRKSSSSKKASSSGGRKSQPSSSGRKSSSSTKASSGGRKSQSSSGGRKSQSGSGGRRRAATARSSSSSSRRSRGSSNGQSSKRSGTRSQSRKG